MTLTELFTNIANAIRAKTGSTEPIIAEDFPSAIEAIPVGGAVDLDAEVTEQETIAASQDALVGDIMAALEGKAVGGGSSVNTCTVNINNTYAEQTLCIDYTTFENGSIVTKYMGTIPQGDTKLTNVVCNSLIGLYGYPGDLNCMIYDTDNESCQYFNPHVSGDTPHCYFFIPNKILK